MTRPFARHWKIAVLWVLSLLVVGAMSMSAQVPRPDGASLPYRLNITEAPTVVSGNDVGFRIERTVKGVPTGRVVIRVDGRWTDTATTVSVR